jgi:uncharacterized protein DUF5996
MNTLFPVLPYEELRATRDTIQGLVQVIASIRTKLDVPQRHWSHAALQVVATGLTTGPLGLNNGSIMQITLNLAKHCILIQDNAGGEWRADLQGRSSEALYTFIQQTVSKLDAGLDFDSLELSNSAGAYDPVQAWKYLAVLTQVNTVLRQFKGTIRERTSPVQFWPHHFDLAMLWFSGRLVAGQDPENEDYADEQMNFGFSTGDEGITEPYFYITMYPWQDAIRETALPQGAYWNEGGWNGAVMPYSVLGEQMQAQEFLLQFFSNIQKAGAELTK